MILLTVEEIIYQHKRLIEQFGGSDGIRDIGLLESAVASVSGSFDDVESYPTIEEKAARFAYALTQNHAFVDGNKRVGMLAMLTTLAINGVAIEYTQQELIDLGLSVADGRTGYDDVLGWIRKHKE